MQCANVNETKENYPKIQAIENVNAGTALPSALEKVAVSILHPSEEQFLAWSITGPSRRK